MTIDATVSRSTYTGTAKALHWLIVALLIVQFILAWTMPEIRRDTPVTTLIGLHFSFGVSILAVAVIRLLLRVVRGVPVPEALEHAQESLRIAQAMGNKLEYGYAYMVLAEIYAQEEYRDWARATWYFEESLKAFREVGAQLDVARAYLAGARISLLKADGKAPELAQMGRAIAAARGARPLAEEAEEILARCRETQSS